jgi:ABC-type siderophore export system fused ATPase/permease subunit
MDLLVEEAADNSIIKAVVAVAVVVAVMVVVVVVVVVTIMVDHLVAKVKVGVHTTLTPQVITLQQIGENYLLRNVTQFGRSVIRKVSKAELSAS